MVHEPAPSGPGGLTAPATAVPPERRHGADLASVRWLPFPATAAKREAWPIRRSFAGPPTGAPGPAPRMTPYPQCETVRGRAQDQDDLPHPSRNGFRFSWPKRCRRLGARSAGHRRRSSWNDRRQTPRRTLCHRPSVWNRSRPARRRSAASPAGSRQSAPTSMGWRLFLNLRRHLSGPARLRAHPRSSGSPQRSISGECRGCWPSAQACISPFEPRACLRSLRNCPGVGLVLAPVTPGCVERA